MTIQEHIHECLNHTKMIRALNPTITDVTYEIMDIPYSELTDFAEDNNVPLRTDKDKKRAFIVYHPFNGNGDLDTTLWLYSVEVNIKPAEIVPID